MDKGLRAGSDIGYRASGGLVRIRVGQLQSMSDVLNVPSNYLMHLVPAVLPIVLSHLTDKEATHTLIAIVGIRDEQKMASRRGRRLARPAGRHAAASRTLESTTL